MAADSVADTEQTADQQMVIKWHGKEFSVHLAEDDTVGSLKRKIEAETEVAPKRQKLLGLKAKKGGGLPADSVHVSELLLKPGMKVMMMGTPEAVTAAVDKMAEVAPHIQDDIDLQEGVMQELDVADRRENQEKLRRRLASVEVKTLSPPRKGKKVVVLDIDYTIFDLGSSAERPEELARPHLHEFMSAVYPHYVRPEECLTLALQRFQLLRRGLQAFQVMELHDFYALFFALQDIIIWSATSMNWVEVKMRELGVSTHPDYKLTCMLDHRAMITVSTEKYGVFDCKPLGFLWGKFPEVYGPHNTIMFDDLRRNYVMNKQNGLVIRPYRKAHMTRDSDRELVGLKQYLLKIAPLEDLSHLRHSRWERYVNGDLNVEPR